MIGAAKPSDPSEPIPRSPRPLCQFQSSVDGMSGHSGSADGDGDSELGAFCMDRSEDEGLTGDSTATLESEAGERSPASTTDCLVSWIAPSINKQVEDALKPLLSILRGEEEDERKHQEKLLAIEKRKLALENEKIQFFTRHGAPSWNNLLISQPQVRFANAASAPDQPVKDEAEEKGVSAKPSSRSDGSLQPPKLSSTVTKDKTLDDENLPIANKLVAFPDVGFCHSDKSNEGDHSSEGGHSHSDKKLPKLEKVVACSNVTSCLVDDSNAGEFSDKLKDHNLSEGDHSHSVDLPKLVQVKRRGGFEHFRKDGVTEDDWVKIVTEDETSDGTKDYLKLVGQILPVPVTRPCSVTPCSVTRSEVVMQDTIMSERTHVQDLPELGFTGSDRSFLDVTVTSPARFCSPFSLISHPQGLATRSEAVMQDTTARDTDLTMMTSESVKSKRGACGKELNPALAKRGRTPNWTVDEKHALLMLKLEASVRGGEVTEGATWNVFVSITLKERHGFDRAPESCQQQSDMLKKLYDAIRVHDANALGTVGGMSYWKMRDQEREALKLPHGFYFGWYVLIERIMCSYSQGAMAGSDGCISPRAPIASAGPGESGSGLLSVVSRSVHPGDETQTENNNFRSSDVGSVVQPGHITVEERLRNALGGPVTLNDPQMAQGQHADCVEEKMPKFPSQVKGKSRLTARIMARRARDSNWSDKQKSQLLMGKLRWFSDRLQQALGGDQSADHHFKSWSHQVAGQLSKTHEQCQGQWDNLLKFRNAIRDHERKIEEGARRTQFVSFWVMSECQKDTANQMRRGDKVELLPQVFPRERYELMGFILEIVEGIKRIPSWNKPYCLRLPQTTLRPRVSELTELEKIQLEDVKRIISLSNGLWGKVEPSNKRFKCSAGGQDLQAYDQMTPSGIYIPHLQNGANANLQYNTCADSDGQAAGVGTDPNIQLISENFADGSILKQPSIAYTEAMESGLILPNTI